MRVKPPQNPIIRQNLALAQVAQDRGGRSDQDRDRGIIGKTGLGLVSDLLIDFDAVDDAREDRCAMGKNLDPRLPINTLEGSDCRIQHDGRGANLVREAICGHTCQPGPHLHAAEPDDYI